MTSHAFARILSFPSQFRHMGSFRSVSGHGFSRAETRRALATDRGLKPDQR